MERELEYEKGPFPDGDADDRETTTDRPDRPTSGLRAIRALPWRVGLLFGLGTFLVNYAVTLRTVAAVGGLYGQDGSGPSEWVVAGFILLSNHGATIRGEVEGLPLEVALTFSGATSLSHSVPLVTLVAAGYGLVRYADLETVREAAAGALTIVPSYLVSMLALAWLARYTYDPNEHRGGVNAPEEVTTFAASLPEAALLAGVLVPATFVLAGGLLAIWPRPLDRLLGETAPDAHSARDHPANSE